MSSTDCTTKSPVLDTNNNNNNNNNNNMLYSQLTRVGVAKSCPSHKYTITHFQNLNLGRIQGIKILMLYSKNN